MLRHDRIKQGDTLEGMLNGAISLDELGHKLAGCSST